MSNRNTNTLIEVKKGEIGRGLLVEQDGFISLDIKNNRKLCESITDEGSGYVHNLPRPFVVHAIFQKYGVENANGRIYPEATLKREVEKYQQAIKERRAYGECYTPDVLILTEKDGWKPLGEVKEGESIMTLNTETHEIEIKPIKKKISYHYDGELIRIKGNGINDLVTPNHKFPFFDRNDKFRGFYSADDLFNWNIKDISKFYIPKIGKLEVESEEYFKINGIENPKGIYIDKRSTKFTKEKYNGIVECLEVENHTWLVMSNGKVHWTGNCNHPEGTSIDLERLAMNIVELHWEGCTLVGQMEIPITEGFRRFGIISSLADTVAQWIISGLKIGVSSRAIGTVSKGRDALIVNDDLELLAFDVVANPSSKGSWVGETYDGIKQYIEPETNAVSVQTNLQGSTESNDKYADLMKWLTGK